MVDAVRSAEKALGKIDYTLTEKQLTSRNFSRSLYVTEDIKKGEIFQIKILDQFDQDLDCIQSIIMKY